MIARFFIGLGFALAASVANAGSTFATDDYTLPFYDPAVSLSYGVDRDPRACYQLDWTGTLWHDCNLHYGRVYDGHTGADYPMSLGSPVAAARDGAVVDLFEGYGTQQFGTYGNYVLVSHADGRRTLYYHLAQNGALVSVGQAVHAGQGIASSGCSGQCYGAHLHFEMRKSTSGSWVPVDPIFEQRYTTNPGRVPFLAAYIRESNAGTEVIERYSTVTHWVEFKNTGGRTWRNNTGVGRILLGTWNPAQHSSPFKAADWGSTWFATNVDQSAVGPDGIGRFTFGLHADVTPGSYDEDFNLLANSLRWFDYARLGSFHVPIYVITNTSQ
ncbi:MAG TPA: M23 family metallopeptidase [Candidatus Limnocylindria bacterium]|nr:M23 family metallopeptidase [Candidatus Limnocylindria bacterium]